MPRPLRLRRWFPRALTPAATPPIRRTPLAVTELEDRVTPATFAVTILLDGGAGSLRAAVGAANATAGADTITFAVTGTINSANPLALTDTTGGTTIDATTAPGYAGAPVVALRGAGSARGIDVLAPNNALLGLQLTNFGTISVDIVGTPSGGFGGSGTASNTLVGGCYVGTDGAAAAGGFYGIVIDGSANNRIGAVNGAGARNVISGNTSEAVRLMGTGSTGNVVGGEPHRHERGRHGGGGEHPGRGVTRGHGPRRVEPRRRERRGRGEPDCRQRRGRRAGVRRRGGRGRERDRPLVRRHRPRQRPERRVGAVRRQRRHHPPRHDRVHHPRGRAGTRHVEREQPHHRERHVLERQPRHRPEQLDHRRRRRHRQRRPDRRERLLQRERGRHPHRRRARRAGQRNRPGRQPHHRGAGVHDEQRRPGAERQRLVHGHAGAERQRHRHVHLPRQRRQPHVGCRDGHDHRERGERRPELHPRRRPDGSIAVGTPVSATFT